MVRLSDMKLLTVAYISRRPHANSYEVLCRTAHEAARHVGDREVAVKEKCGITGRKWISCSVRRRKRAERTKTLALTATKRSVLFGSRQYLRYAGIIMNSLTGFLPRWISLILVDNFGGTADDTFHIVLGKTWVRGA